MAICFVAFAFVAFAMVFQCDKAYAFEGPGNPHWDKTKAVWNAEESNDGRDTIYYLSLWVWEETESKYVERTSIELRNTAQYDFEQYIRDNHLYNREKVKFKVCFKFEYGYLSSQSESGIGQFSRVTLYDPHNGEYMSTAIARIGDLMEMPKSIPPDTTNNYYFSGWVYEGNRWNFGRDIFTEEIADNNPVFDADWDLWGRHYHDRIEYKPWPYNDRLPDEGHYYLVDDMYLRSTQAPSGKLDLCLNGKTIYGKNQVRVLNVKKKADITIWDEEGDKGSLQGNTTYQNGYDGGNVCIDGGKFTLNGGQIKNGQAHEQGGNVLMNGGTFIMNGGSITGGVVDQYGAGVCVFDGTFTLNGGTISGNHGRNRIGFGGGVYVEDFSKFHMTGGTIRDNTAYVNGGGVYVEDRGEFSISGGTITENTSQPTYGSGGLCIRGAGSFSILPGSDGVHTDKILIKGNNGSDVFKHVDAYADANKPFAHVEAVISEDSEIGMGLTPGPKESENVPDRIPLTTGLTDKGNENAGAFFSRDNNYTIVYDGGEAWLVSQWKAEYKAGDHGTGDMSGKTARVVDGESCTLEQNAFTPDQYYKFTGWKTGNTIYQENDTIDSVRKDYTFTAQWEPIEYKITYNLSGGAVPGGVANPKVYTGLTDTFTLVNPQREGYEFTGWTGTGYEEPSTEVTITQGTTGDMEFTANWKMVDYHIEYKLNGGSFSAGQSIPTGYNVETATFTLEEPSFDGYTFTGWLGTDLDEPTKTVTVTKGSTGDRVYYAIFERGCPVGAHQWNEGEVISEPTCTVLGEQKKTCTLCGDVIYEPIPLKPHDWEFSKFDWIGDEENGYTDAWVEYRCKNDGCGMEGVVRADFSSDTIEATCETDGMTNYVAAISAERSQDKREHTEGKRAKVIKAFGHDWGPVRYGFIDGYTKHRAYRTCQRDSCGYRDEEQVNVTTEVKTPATCVSKGWHRYTAGNYTNPDFSRCSGNYIEVQNIDIDPDAHKWDEGVVTKEATTTSEGEMTYTCTLCNTTKTDAIPMIPKKAQKVTVPKDTVTKTFGNAAFSLGAKASGDGTLTYNSSNTKVITVSNAGKATIKGAGTAKVTIKASETANYKAVSKTITVTVQKAANPLKIKAKTAKVKYSKLKKKNQTLTVTKVVKFTKDAKDKKTYTLSSAKKGSKSFKKYFRINKTTGKVTVKKGLKKGTYKVNVKVKAAGNANYKASAVKTVTFKVKVK